MLKDCDTATHVSPSAVDMRARIMKHSLRRKMRLISAALLLRDSLVVTENAAFDALVTIDEQRDA